MHTAPLIGESLVTYSITRVGINESKLDRSTGFDPYGPASGPGTQLGLQSMVPVGIAGCHCHACDSLDRLDHFI